MSHGPASRRTLRKVEIVLPDGNILQAPLVPCAGGVDAKRAKDASIERGETDIGESFPALVSILRKKPGSDEPELVDIDEPGRIVNIRRRAEREMTEHMKLRPLPGPLRVFHGGPLSVGREEGGRVWEGGGKRGEEGGGRDNG